MRLNANAAAFFTPFVPSVAAPPINGYAVDGSGYPAFSSHPPNWRQEGGGGGGGRGRGRGRGRGGGGGGGGAPAGNYNAGGQGRGGGGLPPWFNTGHDVDAGGLTGAGVTSIVAGLVQQIKNKD